jgi:hypothetical protein
MKFCFQKRLFQIAEENLKPTNSKDVKQLFPTEIENDISEQTHFLLKTRNELKAKLKELVTTAKREKSRSEVTCSNSNVC